MLSSEKKIRLVTPNDFHQLTWHANMVKGLRRIVLFSRSAYKLEIHAKRTKSVFLSIRLPPRARQPNTASVQRNNNDVDDDDDENDNNSWGMSKCASAVVWC